MVRQLKGLGTEQTVIGGLMKDLSRFIEKSVKLSEDGEIVDFFVELRMVCAQRTRALIGGQAMKSHSDRQFAAMQHQIAHTLYGDILDELLRVSALLRRIGSYSLDPNNDLFEVQQSIDDMVNSIGAQLSEPTTQQDTGCDNAK